MTKTKIEWADRTWNPITGCLHGCEYCYAKKIARRFGSLMEDGILGEVASRQETSYPFGFDPTLHHYRLNEPTKIKTPQVVFVGSMADMFGNWVPDDWLKQVLEACVSAPWHTYIFLTKNAERLETMRLPQNKNFWYGTTRTFDKPKFGAAGEEHNTFLSIEPLLAPPCEDTLYSIDCWDWVIVGAETCRRKDKVMPKREWIKEIVDACRAADVPVFLKDNLAEIWGEPLIQELPWRS